MKTEDIIENFGGLLEDTDLDAVAAVHNPKNGKTSIYMHGTETTMGGCIVTLLGAEQIGEHNLALIGAYCLARACGFASFKNPSNFAEHLLNYAQVYAQIHGDELSR